MEEKIKEFVKVLNEKFDMGFGYNMGRKYHRITHRIGSNTSAYAFVDNDGHIYMCASWKAPAKHIRGNISDPFKDGCCGRYGIKYLR